MNPGAKTHGIDDDPLRYNKITIKLHNNKITNKLHNSKITNKLHNNKITNLMMSFPNNFELKKKCLLNGDTFCTNSIALKYSQGPEAY